MTSADEVTPRGKLLREAEELITGDRNDTYGTPTQNFTNIADLWNVQFKHLLKDGAKFEPKDVALALIHVKMARTIAQPKRDNFVDLAGYAACGWETTETAEDEAAAQKPASPTTVTVPIEPRPGQWITFNTYGENHDHSVIADEVRFAAQRLNDASSFRG